MSSEFTYTWFTRRCKLDAEMALTRQSVLLPNVAVSYGDVVVTMSSSPCTFVVFVVTAVICAASTACFSIAAISCLCALGGVISAPKMMSRISLCVRAPTLTLFFLA